jgi:hypothetical protein
MSNSNDNNGNLIFSYLQHRAAIGFIGIALPFVVSLYAYLFYSTGLRSSISAYYHTDSRDLFVGMMFAIAAFMLSYRGPEGTDRTAGLVTCISAVVLAIVPTDTGAPEGMAGNGMIHVAASLLFFLSLIYFCLKLFVKTNTDQPTEEKLKRNKIYRACGYTMALSIILIGVLLLNDNLYQQLESLKPVFWLEALAIEAFGISWITKGEVIFADQD